MVPLSRLRDVWVSSSLPTALRSSQLSVRRKLESVLGIYEDLIGVSQVKASHQALLQAEERFVSSQEERRKSQKALNQIQEKVRELRFQLDRTPRGDENYLELIKKEIELVREERTTREIFEHEEKGERERFTQLSTCLRASYEKERAQSEKTKPLFLLMSMIGALVGGSISALSSRAKISQLKQLILDTNQSSVESTLQSVQELILTSSAMETANILHHIDSRLVGGGGGLSSVPSPSSLSVSARVRVPTTTTNNSTSPAGPAPAPATATATDKPITTPTTNLLLVSILGMLLYQIWSRH